MYIPLEPEGYYHVYNHAVGKENLFSKEDNYYFFLHKYLWHINSIADTYAYCLMPNHFHIALSIKSENEIVKVQELSSFNASKELSVENFISKQFSNLFSSYTQAYNKQQNRRGTLFMKPFKRKRIRDEVYMKKLIHYIHYNPVHHGFVDDLRDWPCSSYESFFSEKASKLKREQVIEWFADIDNFVAFHQRDIDNSFELEFD